MMKLELKPKTVKCEHGTELLSITKGQSAFRAVLHTIGCRLVYGAISNVCSQYFVSGHALSLSVSTI